jgi:hypothetical protein
MFKKKRLVNKQNWPYAILEEILENYGESETDISRFLKDEIKIPGNDIVRALKVKDLLNQFESNGILSWKVCQRAKLPDGTFNWDWGNKEYYKENFGVSQTGGLDINRVEARLTLEGLEYATKIVDGIALRRSTIDTNFWMKFFTGIVAIATGATFIVQGYQIVQNNKLQTQPDITIKELKTTLDTSLSIHRDMNLLLKRVLLDTPKIPKKSPLHKK